MNCDICRAPNPPDVRHLPLYPVGSEGINACQPCRSLLTDYARVLMRLVTTGHKEGYKQGYEANTKQPGNPAARS